MKDRRVTGRRAASVAVAGMLFSAAACATGGGGSAGRLLPDGSTPPPCTAFDYPPAPVPIASKAPPTVLEDDFPVDLRLETPGFGVATSSDTGGETTIAADNSKLLFRTEGQSAVPGGFFGDSALILRDRTTGTNTLIASQTIRSAPFQWWNRVAQFLPDGDVAFAEHGYWLPLPPDEPFTAFYDDHQTQVFRWDVDTHDFTVLSLGLDGKPITTVPLGVTPEPGVDLPPKSGPRSTQVSADGRYVFFTTAMPVDPAETLAPLTQVQDLFRRDTLTGEIVQVNVGNYDELGINLNRGWDISRYHISDDGRYATFNTSARHALAETGWCDSGDVLFFRDIEAETTTLVSHDNQGKQRFVDDEGLLSADGRYVMWRNVGDRGMPNVPRNTELIWDRLTGQNDWFVPAQDGTPAGYGEDNPNLGLTGLTGDFVVSASADLTKVLLSVDDEGSSDGGVFPGDGDGRRELVLFDRSANTVRKAQDLPDGTSLTATSGGGLTTPMQHPQMSADGSLLMFMSFDTLLPEDTHTGQDFHTGQDLYSVAL